MHRLFAAVVSVVSCAALWCGLSGPASAAKMPMEPQNRAHLGVSLLDGSSAYGLSGGLDSRLTRFVYVDVGGFMTAFSPELSAPSAEETVTSDWVRMRHSLWAAPGVRIPHRYGEGINWDVFFRAGFGVVWSEDLSADSDWLANAAGLGGIDLLLRKDRVGLRASGKVFGYRPYPAVAYRESWTADELSVFSPQLAIEGVYQW